MTKFALCTRLKAMDYTTQGDSAAYDDFLNDCRRHNLHHLFDTTKGTVLLWDDRLLVTGIYTQRRDRVNTPIRYSLFFQGEEVRSWFEIFVNALKDERTTQTTRLGDSLDALLSLDNNSSSFAAPAYDALKTTLFTHLETPKPQNLLSTCQLWSEFCPVEPTQQAITTYIESLALPEQSNITIQGFAPVVSSKKKNDGRHGSW